VEKRISKPLTHIEVEAERIMSCVVRLTSNSIDGRLEGLSFELRQLQTFLKSEVEQVQSEIVSALPGIKIIIETIAPWVRAVRAGANIETALPRTEHAMQTTMRTTLLVLALVPWGTESALAQEYPPPASGPPPASSPPLASNPPSQSGQYSSNEVIDAGHRFFGTISHGLAEIVEKAGSQWGLPNGYVLGQEAGGAWVAGLRYGEGMLYTKNAGDRRVYWQGPSLGFDFGGDGARTMMLVYDLPATDAIYQRFVGIEGSAYFVGGLGMTALSFNNIVVVPVRSGVGLRLGANVGYLKFTPTSTWNPF
jgi:hypothetical protein